MQDNYGQEDLAAALKEKSAKIAERQKNIKITHPTPKSTKITQTKETKFDIDNITNNSDNPNAIADAIIAKYDSSWNKKKKYTYKKNSRLKIWLITNLIKLAVTIVALYIGLSYLKNMGFGELNGIFNLFKNENVSIENLNDLNQYGINVNNSGGESNVYGEMPTDINGVVNTIKDTYSMYNEVLE